ncbi:hypothetical protein ACRE_070200 [Hapsidospora chrysogenum ATCC 11550]|uniref:Uncharacterized protein n=1 Tax=Hapsidospora chrysogenum (strain ATCC 11550 / CBS 779.69 / DSM 880 / IAM 14645 / JCM 23072 / IMI 49137) TaxID=857340 RepID=A0A086SYS1_HAPC1|nr:hypothetical protein ACRE_070200 [Hapsidospora chrysogenum ATCC 11550]
MARGQSQSIKREARSQQTGNLDPPETPRAKRRRLFNKTVFSPAPCERDPVVYSFAGLSDNELLDPHEEPHAKRRRIFDQIASLPVPPEPDAAAALIDRLSDDELRECYKIAEAGLAAQFEDRKMSADVMEEFLQLVFTDWNPENDEAPGVEMLNDFPIKESFHEFTWNVGSINTGGKVYDVVRSIRMEIDPPRLIMENMQWNVTGKGNMNLEPLKGTDHSLVIWKKADHIRKMTKECYLIMLVEVVGEVSEYSRQRAVAFARNFLGQQGGGDTTPWKRKYTFANLQGILNRLPLLTGQSFYKGDETVVLFEGIFLEMVNSVAGYNRQRAIDYARNFLTQEATGVPTARIGRYTFAPLDAALLTLPLVSGSSFYFRKSLTVVLFSMSELRDVWDGKKAWTGSQVLEKA